MTTHVAVRNHPRHRLAALLIAFVVAFGCLTAACTAAAPGPGGAGPASPAGSLTAVAAAASASTSAEPTPYKRKPWPSPTASPKRPSAADVYPGVNARIVEAQMAEMPYYRELGYMGVSAGFVWAATSTGLIRIDPDDMSVFEVDDAPGFGMFATESSVWASDFDRATVTRYDPETASQTMVSKVYGSPEAISVFGDNVWVAQHHGGSIARLDGPSGGVLAEVKVGLMGSSGPQGILATADSVWVGIPNSTTVVRVDPDTNTVVATIPVVTLPCGPIAATVDAVWVSSCFEDEMIVRIDPRTNGVVGEFSIGGYNGAPVVVNGYPWFPVENRLVRFNPATNEVDGVVEFADEFHAYGTAVGFDSIWVGSVGGRNVARVPLDVLEDWATE